MSRGDSSSLTPRTLTPLQPGRSSSTGRTATRRCVICVHGCTISCAFAFARLCCTLNFLKIIFDAVRLSIQTDVIQHSCTHDGDVLVALLSDWNVTFAIDFLSSFIYDFCLDLCLIRSVDLHGRVFCLGEGQTQPKCGTLLVSDFLGLLLRSSFCAL